MEKKKIPLIFGRWNRLEHPCDPKLKSGRKWTEELLGKRNGFLYFIYLVRTYKIAESSLCQQSVIHKNTCDCLLENPLVSPEHKHTR